VIETQHRTVLVVEDDDSNRLLISRFLESRGYCVLETADGPAALQALNANAPDVVVLDLGLPGLDGLNVLRRVRRESGVPVLVLTGRAEERSKLEGFAAGADDYLVKPFSMLELEARLSALLRRGIGMPMPSLERFVHGSLLIDIAAAQVTVDGHEVQLRPQEFALLAFLASSPGRVYSRTELLEHVWGTSSQWQDGATVTEHIRRIRRKLSQWSDESWSIETVRGFGYKFSIVS
jgi:DNA-binding response OmpR family regulator